MSIECEFTDVPVCPHCNYHHRDVWEWNFGPCLDGEIDEMQCESCNGKFSVSRHCRVTYSTKKVSKKA